MKLQADLKGQHNFISFDLYLADPATFHASNTVLGTLFTYESSLFDILSFYYYLINIVLIMFIYINKKNVFEFLLLNYIVPLFVYLTSSYVL